MYRAEVIRPGLLKSSGSRRLALRKVVFVVRRTFCDLLTLPMRRSTRVMSLNRSSLLGGCLRNFTWAEREPGKPGCCFMPMAAALAAARGRLVSLDSDALETTFTGEARDWLMRVHSPVTFDAVARAWASTLT